MLQSYSEEHLRIQEQGDKTPFRKSVRDKQKRTEMMDKFNLKFRGIKLKNHLEQFIRNIKRNNIYSEPIDFHPRQTDTHLINIKGIQISHKYQNIVLILDIIFTLANFVLSTFQAFLPDYQHFKDQNPQIIIINIIAVIIYLFKTVVSLINQEVQHGIHYVYLTDIVKKQLLKGRFMVQISLAIIIIVNISMTADSYSTVETVGIIYFIFCIFKIYNLSFSLVKIELMIINNAKKERYWNLFKVLVFNLLIAHFMASIFLAMLKIDNNRNWYQTKYNAVLDPYWFQLYIWAYYWACTTMITIGYGDFVPANKSEAIIVSFIQIFSSIVIAYNISQIGSIILSINEKSKAINSKIGLLRRINKKNKIPIQISIELEEFIVQSQNIQQDFQYSKHQQLISSMPKQLQQKYYSAAIVNIYRKLPFFMNLGSQTLMNFFQEQTGKVYYPGQFIIKKSFAQQISIVLKGQIGFCYKRIGATLNDTVIEKLTVNYQQTSPIFLAKNVLNRNEGIYFDVKSTKYSYGVNFSIDKFIEILKQSEIDYHYYLMVLDMHQAQSSLAINKCGYCSKQYHTKFECPRLHYIPFSAIIISRYNSIAQLRKPLQKKVQFNRRKPLFKINHVYRLKNKLNNELGQILSNLHNFESKNYLQMAIQLFGDKEIQKKGLSNKIKKKVYSDSLVLVHIVDDQKEDLEEFQTLTNFHHYFTSFNPSKLQGVSLSRMQKKSIYTNYSL